MWTVIAPICMTGCCHGYARQPPGLVSEGIPKLWAEQEGRRIRDQLIGLAENQGNAGAPGGAEGRAWQTGRAKK
jgi:hypothetical protein